MLIYFIESVSITKDRLIARFVVESDGPARDGVLYVEGNESDRVKFSGGRILFDENGKIAGRVMFLQTMEGKAIDLVGKRLTGEPADLQTLPRP